MDKFVSPCEKPTEYQAELLHILMEECGEVIQEASKCLRFGLLEQQPGNPRNNAQRLSQEIGQLRYMMLRLMMDDITDHAFEKEGYDEKPDKLQKYLQAERPSEKETF